MTDFPNLATRRATVSEIAEIFILALASVQKRQIFLPVPPQPLKSRTN
jgi:hypothetical protein